MSTLSKIDVPAGKNVIKIMNSNGHTEHVYDPAIEVEVAEAMEVFEESMEKGMRAFRLDEDGGGELIREFEPAPRVLIKPQDIGG